MENFKSFDSSPHKIQQLWEDITKLIALEEDLLRRIEALEKEMDDLWRKYSTTVMS